MIPFIVPAEEDISKQAAEWAVTLLFTLPAAYFLSKAIHRPPTRSYRFACLSLFAGLMIIAGFEGPLGFRDGTGGRLFLAGLFRAILATAGIVFALRALRLRRTDQGTGAARPAIGAALCVFHLIYGISLLAFPSLVRSGVDGTPWTYQSPADGYSITLPGKQWTEARMKDASSAFRCRVLQAQVGVFAQTAARERYLSLVNDFKANSLPKLTGALADEGKNAAGHEYAIFQGGEKRPGSDKDFQLTICFIWKAGTNQVISVIAEASPTNASDTGLKLSIKAFQEATSRICLSVN